MNRYSIIATLTKDAVVKEASGRKVINFSIAYNESFKGDGTNTEKSYFYNCVIWRDSNVKIAEFLTKGTKVLVEGRPEPELYKDGNGDYKAAIKIICSNIELHGGGTRRTTNDNHNSNNGNSNYSYNNNSGDSKPKKDKKDDLPF